MSAVPGNGRLRPDDTVARVMLRPIGCAHLRELHQEAGVREQL